MKTNKRIKAEIKEVDRLLDEHYGQFDRVYELLDGKKISYDKACKHIDKLRERIDKLDALRSNLVFLKKLVKKQHKNK